MQMTAADIAYMKGEAAVQPGDTAADALKRAAEHGYLAPAERRTAFVQGFVANCPDSDKKDARQWPCSSSGTQRAYRTPAASRCRTRLSPLRIGVYDNASYNDNRFMLRIRNSRFVWEVKYRQKKAPRT